MSEMYAVMNGPAFEAELAYRRETAQRFVRAGGFGLRAGAPRRRTPRRRGLRLPVGRPRPAAVA